MPPRSRSARPRGAAGLVALLVVGAAPDIAAQPAASAAAAGETKGPVVADPPPQESSAAEPAEPGNPPVAPQAPPGEPPPGTPEPAPPPAGESLPPPALPPPSQPTDPVAAPVAATPTLAPAAPPADGGPATVAASRGSAALEVAVGIAAGAHFPGASGRSVEEALDGVGALGLWSTGHPIAVGIGVERLGLGKDHYDGPGEARTVNASYLVDTLWLGGRYSLSRERPAAYLGVAVGPALPRLSATGTADGGDAFGTRPRPFECADAGRLGAGLALAAGVEADVAASWSVLGEVRASGHLLSSAADAHGSCGPGSGASVGGALRLGVAYRFGP